MCSNSADDQIGKFVPNELNFVFDGLMKFTFALKNSSFSRTVKLRLAQGSFERILTAGNNWWIASKDCNVSVVAKLLFVMTLMARGRWASNLMGIMSQERTTNSEFSLGPLKTAKNPDPPDHVSAAKWGTKPRLAEEKGRQAIRGWFRCLCWLPVLLMVQPGSILQVFGSTLKPRFRWRDT